MVQDYPTLRIRQLNNKLECELTEPTSMQITGIETKITRTTKRTINKHYAEILRITGDKEPKITEFKKALNRLGNKIGKILKEILEKLAFEVRMDSTLALALDDETVKIPWELGLIPRKLTGKNKRMFCDVVCIGRLRVVKADFWGPSPLKRKFRRALVVGINYKGDRRRISPLEHAEEEAEEVGKILENNNMNVTLLPGKKATLSSVTRELKRGVDIFHFTGHGSMSWNKGRIRLFNKDLWAKDLENLLANSVAPSLSSQSRRKRFHRHNVERFRKRSINLR